MRQPKNIARYGLILTLAGVLSGATLVPKLASAQTVTPSWSVTGDLNTPRYDHTATLLPNGKVLVAGGAGPLVAGDQGPDSCFTPTSSAELYDPVSGTWSHAGSLNTARVSHTATLLQNGQVLVAGGYGIQDSLNSAELYDPATGMWRPTGSFNTIGANASATLLPNGKVLAVGASGAQLTSISAELYDPATETWSSTGAPSFVGGRHTVLLLNGKVLAVLEGSPWDYGAVGTELYDPATGQWSPAGAGYLTMFWAPSVTLLRNGKVLVAGLYGANYPTQADLYDTNAGTWSSTGNLSTFRHYGGYTATLLADGHVLLAGGVDYISNQPVSAEELYDPAIGTWSLTSRLIRGRSDHTATLLQNGKVLVAGGFDGLSGCDAFILRSAELYDPATSSPIDDASFFVRQHYLDFLNREPDADGLAYWTSQITQCGSDGRCIHQRRIAVSAAFFIELEFQDSGYYVYRFYKASLGRQPSYAEFTSDRSRVIGGSNLEANKQAFADEWVQRDAFTQAYSNTMSNTEVVNKLFDRAGLTASIYDSLRQQEIQAMNAGRSRALVLRDVIEVPDFKNIPDPNDPRYAEIKRTSQYNPAFVLMQYFGYLQRNVDEGGYDFWLDVVNNRQPNNYHGMVCSFITSPEYQLRFGSVVTRSNADCAQ